MPKIWALVLLLIGLTVIGCGEGPDRSRDGYLQVAGSPSMVVARVGEHEISRLDLARAVNASAGPLLARGGCPPDDFEQTILEMMIRSELLFQLGLESAGDAARQREEELFAQHLARFPSETALAEALARDGLTVEEFRASLKKQAVVEVFLEREVHNRIEIPDRQVEEYYRAHPEIFLDEDGEPRPLDEVSGEIRVVLAGAQAPGMIEQIIKRAEKTIPVERFYVESGSQEL